MPKILKKIKLLKIDSLLLKNKKSKSIAKKSASDTKIKTPTKTKKLFKTPIIRKNKNQIKNEIKKLPKKLVLKVPKKPDDKEIENKKDNKEQGIKLERSLQNPIITPRLYSWESKATLNPTAFQAFGTIHILYRAIGEEDVSVLGYASSFDGYHIQERPTYYIYKRTGTAFKANAPVTYDSGGGWSGGCEDPRVTLLGDTVYMFYTAFDGWSSVRMALTSIKLEDFKNKKWNWEKPVLVSPPGELHKNWGLFPEKINGKFAIIHGISPRVLVDYVDDLDVFDGNTFIHSMSHDEREKGVRETGVRSMGPSPIKTKLGWLVLYHGSELHDRSKYKLFAMILDLKDPTKVLYRSKHPILGPEKTYENQGHKSGVVYSCGAVVKYGRLFVYYGGADTVTCVASIILDELLASLVDKTDVKLKNKKIIKIKDK